MTLCASTQDISERVTERQRRAKVNDCFHFRPKSRIKTVRRVAGPYAVAMNKM